MLDKGRVLKIEVVRSSTICGTSPTTRSTNCRNRSADRAVPRDPIGPIRDVAETNYAEDLLQTVDPLITPGPRWSDPQAR